jgi:hypothetical protein
MTIRAAKQGAVNSFAISEATGELPCHESFEPYPEDF